MKTNRRLVLHLGLHKTGTTTIQRVCAASQRALAQVGFSYPLVRSTDRARGVTYRDTNHSRLVQHLVQPEVAATGQETDRMSATRASLESWLARDGRNLLLIAEEGSLLTVSELQTLRQYFTSLGYSIEVYCTVRTPLQWLNSMVAQGVIGRRSKRRTITAMVESFVETGGIVRPRMRNIEDVFPQVKFSAFADLVRHPGGPAAHFFETAGIPFRLDKLPAQENEGRSDPAVRLAHAINVEVGWRFTSDKHDAFYTRMPRAFPFLYEVPGPKFFLRRDELRPLALLLEQENAWLGDRFGAAFCEQALSFSDAPTAFSDEARQFLAARLENLPQPLRSIARGFADDA